MGELTRKACIFGSVLLASIGGIPVSPFRKVAVICHWPSQLHMDQIKAHQRSQLATSQPLPPDALRVSSGPMQLAQLVDLLHIVLYLYTSNPFKNQGGFSAKRWKQGFSPRLVYYYILSCSTSTIGGCKEHSAPFAAPLAIASTKEPRHVWLQTWS